MRFWENTVCYHGLAGGEWTVRHWPTCQGCDLPHYTRRSSLQLLPFRCQHLPHSTLAPMVTQAHRLCTAGQVNMSSLGHDTPIICDAVATRCCPTGQVSPFSNAEPAACQLLLQPTGHAEPTTDSSQNQSDCPQLPLRQRPCWHLVVQLHTATEAANVPGNLWQTWSYRQHGLEHCVCPGVLCSSSASALACCDCCCATG
jgi:hypothetical protein